MIHVHVPITLSSGSSSAGKHCILVSICSSLCNPFRSMNFDQ